ncbi:MAG: DNA replication complex subunit Gins51 [Promethearchaeota archaeon]|jgi:DNA replication initiation complex subunit (GINS family)
MNLKTDYRNLYNHWLKEYEQSELTPLTQENYNYYKNTVDFIIKYELEGGQPVERQLLKSYKYGFNYLFNDFLKIREVKLINAALILQDIDYNNIIEAEKLFYQNLVSAIKGFKKLKTLTLYEDDEPIELSTVLADEEVLAQALSVENSTENATEDTNIVSTPKKTEEIQPKQVAQYNYILIRFNNPSPPLVGIDGVNYGPFQENDISNMPYKNAKILIYEKLAEKIDFI